MVDSAAAPCPLTKAIIAVNVTENYPSLQRVVVVKRPKRYDSQINDQLSKYGNNVLNEVWVKLGSPEKIVIGEQDLACDNELRTLRYGLSHYQKL